LESLGEIPIAGRLLDGIFHGLKILKREMEVPENTERVAREGLLSSIPVAGSLIESLGEIPIAGRLLDGIFHGLHIVKREMEVPENAERVAREGLLSSIPVAGTLLESLGEIPIAGRLLDGIFHGLKILKREMEVPENAERVAREGLLSSIPVAGTLLESLGEIPIAGRLLDGIFHGLKILKREMEVPENAERVAREGILTHIPVAGSLIESLGEIPIAGRLLDGIFHGLKIVREMEIPEGTEEEKHSYVKRQLCAEIPIIRKWCHAVAEIPLIGKPIQGLAQALKIM